VSTGKYRYLEYKAYILSVNPSRTWICINDDSLYTERKNGEILTTCYGGGPKGDVSSEVSYRLEQRRDRLKPIVKSSGRH
jgi:hypothetical protein